MSMPIVTLSGPDDLRASGFRMKNPAPTLDEVAQHVRDFHGCLLTYPQYFTLFPKQRELARHEDWKIEREFLAAGNPPANGTVMAFCRAHHFSGMAFQHCFIIHDRTVEWALEETLR